MRLARLDLTRYGHFTDAALDFGSARDVDVTLVYGDNEAGKSTVFAAWLDLLYGIPRRSAHAFLHARAQMQVGAALDAAAGRMEVVRTGARLADAAGHALEETRLAGLLHNLDRAAYATRFSLDDETLRLGGAEIAQGRGDLGQALHVGASGLAGVGAALDTLGARADAFHQKRGSAQVLPKAKAELVALAATLREAELPPPRWDALQAAVGRADARVAEVGAARQAADRELALCAAALDLAGVAREAEVLRETLATLPDGPDLPSRAEADLLAALAVIADAEADRDGRRAARASANAALEAYPEEPDAALLMSEVERIGALLLEDGSRLVDRAATGGSDLANRRSALAKAAAERDVAITEAGEADATAPSSEAVEALDATLSEVEATARAVEVLEARIVRERAALPPETPSSGDRETLAAALADVPDAAVARDLSDTAREAAATAAREAETLPDSWAGLRDGLPEPEEVDAALGLLRRAEAGAGAAETARNLAAEVVRRATSAREAAQARPGAADTTDRAASRRVRDRAWDRHLAALDLPSAEAFAEAMRDDDAVAERHATGAGNRAALAAAATTLDVAAGDLAAREREFGAAQVRVDDLVRLLATLASRVGSRDLMPDAIRPRLLRLRAAMVAAGNAVRAQARAREASDVRDARLAEVARLLGKVPGTDIIREARSRLDVLLAQEIHTKDRTERLAAIDEVAAELATAAELAGAAREVLAHQIAGTPLADRDPGSLRRAIAPLRRAAIAARAHADLEDRIGKLTLATGRLEMEVTILRRVLPIGADAEDGVAVMRAAGARAAEVRAAGARRAEAARVVAETGAAIATLDRRIREGRATIARVFAGQGEGAAAGDPRDRVATLLQRDVSRSAVRTLAERNTALRALLDAAALEAEMGVADGARFDDLTAARTVLDDDLASAQEARGAARQALEQALDGQGGMAARQRRATLIEQIRHGAREAVVARLGEAAARRALLSHQEASRGRMLEAAQAAFARLTGGAWTRLETGEGEKGEALFAIGHGGRTRVDAMSTGTRGQVYLALRLAGHAAFTESSGPLPFVLDDVAETFDDSRARATLTMLGEIGARGQAILLTHHRHLVEMARDTLPGVRVLTLPPRS